jgi:glycosyltransferase involved in cell wall biosynthesis
MTTGRSSPYRVGLLGPSRLSPNTDALLVNLGALLQDHFDLHLALGSGCESTRLRTYYRIHPYEFKTLDRGEIRTSLAACRQLAKNVRPHLLVSLVNPASAGLAVATVGRRSGIAHIVRMSGHSFEEAAVHRQPWKRLKAWLLHDRMAGTAYRRAGHIIALGRRLKDALVIRGIDPGKITVLPQPVDRERFRPLAENGKTALKTALGMAPERKTILYAGRLS